jgi:hypothetical protein
MNRLADLMHGLAQGQTLFGLFDGAQDPRIAQWIRTGDVPWGCLYRGQIPPELVEVAPYIVKLDSRSATVRKLSEHGVGRNWAVFLSSASPLAEIRTHFRRYLRVASEDRKRTMLFRFYDPRVLRLYLPTCTPRERAAFFGPVEAFFLETAEGFEVLETREEPRAVSGP